MEKVNINWTDKQGYIPIIIILGVIISTVLWFLIGAIAKETTKDTIVCLVLLVVIVIWTLTSFHYLPLKVKNGEIYLASGKFPSFGRKRVALKDTKKVSITTSKRLDEGGSVSPIEFIRAEDIHGNKYRNVIYSVSGFKEVVQSLVDEEIIQDESWLKFLPKKLR